MVADDVFLLYLYFYSFCSKHRTLLFYLGVCRAGRWVQCAECLLALLTFIRAYRKPPGTKDLQSALFSLAKTLPKHTAHSHTPRTQCQQIL